MSDIANWPAASVGGASPGDGLTLSGSVLSLGDSGLSYDGDGALGLGVTTTPGSLSLKRPTATAVTADVLGKVAGYNGATDIGEIRFESAGAVDSGHVVLAAKATGGSLTDVARLTTTGLALGGSFVPGRLLHLRAASNPGFRIEQSGTGQTGFLFYVGARGDGSFGIFDEDAGLDRLIIEKSDGALDYKLARVALGGGAAPTLGTIGGSGPTAAAQAGWMRIKIAGTNHWVPVWT